VPELRPFWKRYTEGIRSIVFVVDPTAPTRFPEAVTALSDLLRTLPAFKQVPLLVLINKSESTDAVSKDQVEEAFDLGNLRPYNVSFRNVSMMPKGAASVDQNVFYSHQLVLAMNWLCSGL
jgi:signal recognition particle receptor subunit beta